MYWIDYKTGLSYFLFIFFSLHLHERLTWALYRCAGITLPILYRSFTPVLFQNPMGEYDNTFLMLKKKQDEKRTMKLDYLFSMTFLQSPFTWETNLSPLQVHRVYFTIFYRSIPQDFFKIPWGNTIILYLLIKINENEKRPRERIFFTDFLQSPFTWKKD